MNSDTELIEAITKAFGRDAYTEEGVLNRSYLARTVFADRERLDRLNGLVHPKVAEDFSRWISEPQQRQSAYTVKEAALLFESGSYKALKATIAVLAPEAEKIRRVLLRDTHRDKQQVQQIIRNQMRDKERVALADYLIQNDGATPLIPQVQRLHQMFREWTLPK
jgi:dephospho-CoA kinase